MSQQHEPEFKTDAELAEGIQLSTSELPVETSLRTDERVLARVTDGIYRQPGSAIRELVSNAYDADAKRVVIKTDRPRFRTLSVEDDGIGMTPAALAHLLHHIGGSAKRSPKGAELRIARPADPTRSPSGRRLIGKIGIGLFSVAQLTHSFQIITKTAGDSYRTIATVVLRQYADKDAPSPGEVEAYTAGLVTIWRERAVDLDSQGTAIILTNLRPETRNTLQSRDLWDAFDTGSALAQQNSRNIETPYFHIGRVRTDNEDILRGDGDVYHSMPWSPEDAPEAAFKKLVAAVWDYAERGTPNPKIERIFDYYLQMVWQLSLAIPAQYVSENPFDIPLKDKLFLFEMPQSGRTTPIEFELTSDDTIQLTKSIGSAAEVGSDFTVLVDDLRLARPLRFTDLPETSHAVKKPILVVGRYREEFDGMAPEFTGGPLAFEAYLMWAPKVAPTEHQGVLIRLHGSSGTLFDPTFLRYQVSELTRLRQISCEIFVSEGLEAALNIDRESFNFAHPHVVHITKWLHTALRHLATIQKRIASGFRAAIREAAAAEEEEVLASIAAQAWQYEFDDEGAEPPLVEFVGAADDLQAAASGAYQFRREPIFGERRRRSARQDESVERKLRAMIQVLATYGIFESLPDQQQERLLGWLRQILDVSET